MLPSIQIGSIFWGNVITTEMMDVAPIKRDELLTAHQPGPTWITHTCTRVGDMGLFVGSVGLGPAPCWDSGCFSPVHHQVPSWR